MSYLFEMSAIGGIGGAPFDHRDTLQQQSLHMGVGAKGVHLSKLHLEAWTGALSHSHATYTSWSDPERSVTTAGVGNIRNLSAAVDINIAPDERVVMFSGEYGFNHYMAGGVCLTYVQLTLQSVDGARRIVGSGQRQFPEHQHEQPGNHRHPRNYAGNLQVVPIPVGLTLAGIAGRAGDSWDQLRLFVCPWLPRCGTWSRTVHRHYLQPFREQVRAVLMCLARMERNGSISKPLPAGVKEELVAALFKVELMSEHVPAAAAADGADEAAADGAAGDDAGVVGPVSVDSSGDTAAAAAGLAAASNADAAVAAVDGAGAAAAAGVDSSGDTTAAAAAAGNADGADGAVAAAVGGDYLWEWVRQQVNDVDLMLLLSEPHLGGEDQIVFDSDEYEFDDSDEFIFESDEYH